MLLMFWITATLSPSLVWQSQAGDTFQRGIGFNSSQHGQSPPSTGGRPFSGGLRPLLPNPVSSNNTEYTNHSVEDFLISYQQKVISLKSLLHELTEMGVQTPRESNLLKAVQTTLTRPDSSCMGRCGLEQRNLTCEQETEKMLCFCDIYCNHFGDCCYDFHSSCPKEKLHNGFDVGSRTCDNANNPNVTWYGDAMMSTCPVSPANKNKRSSCFSDDRTFNLRWEVPVIDRINNRTYRSVMCASCNNITDVIPWVLTVFNCLFLKNVTNIVDWLKQHPGQCIWKYEAPSGGRNLKCILRMSDSPRVFLKRGNLSVICDICDSYAMVFRFGDKLHRNPHCVLCDPKSGKNSNDHKEGSTGMPASLRVLLNFDTNERVPDVPSTSKAAKRDGQQTIDAERVITTVGCCTSIVALLVLIVVYALFKELRNLPGKVLMNLACSIIFYQAVFLSSGQTEIRAVCVVIAVLLHYFLLASFVWMAVMGYDLVKTFTSNGVNVRQCVTKTLVVYCCLAWGGPLVLVVILFTLDVTGAAYFGYGMGEVCWIHSGVTKILSVGVPVAFALLFNLVAIVRTMVAIHQTKKVTRRVATQRAQPSLAFLCAKLTMVLGVPWVLGYVANYSPVVRYIYIVLNAFQGLFISLVFLTNKRVLDLLRCNRRMIATETPKRSTTRTAVEESQAKEVIHEQFQVEITE